MWSCGKFDAGGHIERMETENWVSKYRSLMNDDAAGRGRPCKTWKQVVQNDLQALHLEKTFAQDHERWRDASTILPMLAWNTH